MCFWEQTFGSYETARSLQGSTCWKVEKLLRALRLLGVLGLSLVEVNDLLLITVLLGAILSLKILIVQRKHVII